MADDKIHYSDLIAKDDSIQQLIQALTDLNSTYGTTLETIKQGADKIVTSLSKASGATKQGRAEIEQASAMATKLERVYKGLENTLNRMEKRLTQVGAQLTKTNKESVKQAKEMAKAAAGSYDDINNKLKETVAFYKSLSEAERIDPEFGGKLLTEIQDYNKQLQEIDKSLKPIIEKTKQQTAATQANTKAQKEKKPVLDSAQKQEQKLANATGEVAERTAVLRQETALAAAQTRQAAIASEFGANSYEALRAKTDALVLEYKQLDQSTEANVIRAKELAGQIRTLRAQLGIMEEQIGSSNLGNYGSDFNRLGYSVQQVVREVPSAAIGFQTFFLAISNNIPIVIDEINRLREANKANAAINKSQVIPIGKQVLAALFNWQTLLIGLITVFSMYGDEILAWCKKVLTGKEAALSYAEAMGKVRKEFKEDMGQAGKNIALYEALRIQWSELRTEADKTDWLEKNADLTGELGVELENVNEANAFFLQNAEAIRQAYVKQAMAEAAMALASAQAEEAIKSQMKVQELRRRQAAGDFTFWEKFRATFAQAVQLSTPGFNNTENLVTAGDILADKITKAEDKTETFNQSLQSILQAYNDLSAAADTAFAPFSKTTKGTDTEGRDLEERLNNLYLKAKKNYENDLTSLERNEAEKRRKQAQDDYAQRIRDIDNDIRKANAMLNNEEGKYKDLTDEQKRLLAETIKTLEQSKVTAMSVLMRALFEADDISAQATRDFLSTRNELQEELATEGSQEQLNIQLAALDLELAAMKAANQKKEEIYRQDEKVFEDIINKRKKLLQGTYELGQFEKQQSIAATQFNTGRPSQTAATQFDLQQQIDLIEKQKQLATEGKLQWTPEDFALADAQLAKLNKELDESKDIISRIGKLGVTGTILDALGFDAEAISAFQDAVNTVISNLQEIAQAEVDAAQAAVDAAEERVSAAQSAYDAEIEARNNGYANSVATAKAELQQEKKKQQEKERLLAEAQKRQDQLNSLTQVSSLITASANLWASMTAGTGIIGPILAAAAIATMWGSFAAAKTKARQVAAQEYGEGGLEFLEGGSHASGNDIDLGTTNSRGRRMRAEGGEAMAIINRRNTRRYRRVLPAIVDSLNRGTFEEKYLNAFKSGDVLQAQISAIPSNIDLTRLEREVSEIKKQNSVKYFSLNDGTTVVVKGNVKTIIKQ